MKKTIFSLLFLGILLMGFNLLSSYAANDNPQTGPTDPVTRLKSWEHHMKLKNESIFKNLKWRAVGPEFMGGRIESIACPPGYNSTIYVGVGSGNVWKTINNGTTWEPIFENESTFTIGAVAVSQSNHNIVWVGTGEVLMARSSFAGTGVFRSTDAGKTWKNMGLNDTHHIGRVLIDPKDHDIVYVAAIGHSYSYNEERGLFKTTDGGKTWNKILYISDKVGVVEVVMDPSNNKTLYSVAWERDRKAWNNVISGEGSGIYKTTDAGLTWKRLTNGLPQGKHVGRSGLSVSISNPNVVYAVVDNQALRPKEKKKKPTSSLTISQLKKMTKEEFLKLDPKTLETFLRENGVSREYSAKDVFEAIKKEELTPKSLAQYFLDLSAGRELRGRVIGGEIYRSDNKGETWRKVNEDYLETRIGYDFCLIRVSPDNENEIYVLGNNLLVSEDGGKTYRINRGKIVHLLQHDIRVLHLDHHELWIDPLNPDRLLLGNDGGLYISYDRGETWLHTNNLPIGEFYAISVDMATPYNIYGGTQDDAALYGPSTHNLEDRLNKHGVEDPWKHIYLDRWGGGDSYFTEVDPTDPNTIYYEHQFGRLRRKNLKSASTHRQKSTEEGSTIDIMPRAKIGEPPLRYNWMAPFVISHYNPDTLYYGAHKLFKSLNRGDNWICLSPDLTTNPGLEKQGNVPYGTVTTISESPLKPGLIYVGTDDGNVQVTKNDGVSWAKINTGLPQKWVSRVVASRYDEGTVYVSLTGYREDDFEKYLYMSIDFGKTWKSIAGNLPSEPINVVRDDPRNKNILYVGTDHGGVYTSLDRGKTWYSICNNLPTAAVHDLVVHPRDNELVIGTHGRSIFVLDVEKIQKFN